MAKAEANVLPERKLAVRGALPHAHPEAGLEVADVVVEVGRPAGGAGADAHVAAPARLAQVVVVGGDAVDRSLGQPRYLRCEPPVVVGDGAALVDRLPKHSQRGPCTAVGACPLEQLDQVSRHGPSTLLDEG